MREQVSADVMSQQQKRKSGPEMKMEGAYFSTNGLFGVVAPNGKFTKACARVGRCDLENTSKNHRLKRNEVQMGGSGSLPALSLLFQS